MRLDAHNYARRIETFFLRIDKTQEIPPNDKVILRRYRDYLISEGISLGRVAKYLSDLRKAAVLLAKNYELANEDDIRRIVSALDQDERYSPWSKRDFKVSLRKFYTWLRKTKEYPPEVAWLSVYARIRHARSAEDMLTEEEVKRLIESAKTVQMKAFFAALYESGCRIGELIYLKLNQVKFDEYGAQFFVTGKTGFRRIRVVACVPYLTAWINDHPLKSDPGSFLWINRKREPFSYNGLCGIMKLSARSAGINKRVNPHNFRHSRATYLANHLTDAQMKEHFGWTQDSKMAGVYVHLSGRDVDCALLKVYGIDNIADKKESILKPKDCVRCHLSNQATNRFCSRCGLPLDEDAKVEVMKKDMERKEADGVLDKLIEDREFRELLLRKIGQLASSPS
jgi:site-specific recombinase XerD